jgi:hypothetical protein
VAESAVADVPSAGVEGEHARARLGQVAVRALDKALAALRLAELTL